MLVYSHRVQAILKQSVVELGLTLALSDKNAKVSLKEHQRVFEDAAMLLAIECEKVDEGDSLMMVFRPK